MGREGQIRALVWVMAFQALVVFDDSLKVTSSPDTLAVELVDSLPRLAKLANLAMRLQGAAKEILREGFDGVQILVFGRRHECHNVRRGDLPFWFAQEQVARGRRILLERFDLLPKEHECIHLPADGFAPIEEFGQRAELHNSGLYLFPLRTDERTFGFLSLSDSRLLLSAQKHALKVWSEIFVSFVSNDLRITHYEELEHLMRSLRGEHDLEGVLQVVVEALAYEYGATCEIWRHERLVWARMAASPTTARIEDVDFSPIITGEEGVVALGRAVGVPLVVEERLWGAIVLDESVLNGERWYFMRNVARHSELALENALVFERHRQFAHESAALSDAGRTLLAYTRIEPLANAICRLAVELGEAEQAVLYLEQPDESFASAGAFVRGVASSMVLSDHELRVAVHEQMSLVERKDHLLLLPLGDRMMATEEGTLRGCLAIHRSHTATPMTLETIRLLEAFATLGTLALRNVRLFEASTETNRALGESNAFKDDLLAMFTHDFKGPLTVIAGYGELVLEKLYGEERESVAIILAQVRRLATLADDALALARAQATGFVLERTPGELVGFVRDLLQQSFGTRSERIILEARVEKIELNFDHHAMRHVLENVIGNALKYSDQDVRVEVLLERSEAAVIVRDRGIGIPADELVHVFGRFARASNARRRGISGSGIGLYIANRLVEEHGGAIFVSSCEGEGSTFEVRIPR